jgi:hypothetical protein
MINCSPISQALFNAKVGTGGLCKRNEVWFSWAGSYQTPTGSRKLCWYSPLESAWPTVYSCNFYANLRCQCAPRVTRCPPPHHSPRRVVIEETLQRCFGHRRPSPQTQSYVPPLPWGSRCSLADSAPALPRPARWWDHLRRHSRYISASQYITLSFFPAGDQMGEIRLGPG